ncbi:MAG: hypothetical protein IAE79_00395 [Anaerolinea sp.]|nr:hypothetical protein [Anaerolinea sp.]
MHQRLLVGRQWLSLQGCDQRQQLSGIVSGAFRYTTVAFCWRFLGGV